MAIDASFELTAGAALYLLFAAWPGHHRKAKRPVRQEVRERQGSATVLRPVAGPVGGLPDGPFIQRSLATMTDVACGQAEKGRDGARAPLGRESALTIVLVTCCSAPRSTMASVGPPIRSGIWPASAPLAQRSDAQDQSRQILRRSDQGDDCSSPNPNEVRRSWCCRTVLRDLAEHRRSADPRKSSDHASEPTKARELVRAATAWSCWEFSTRRT